MAMTQAYWLPGTFGLGLGHPLIMPVTVLVGSRSARPSGRSTAG
jgi:hypothetical protein